MSANTPGTTPTWKTEFNERIKAFATAIGVAEEKVKEVLAGLGVDGESDQSLTIIDSEEYLPMGDLRSAFVDSELTQISRLRVGMPHLRGATQDHANVAPTANDGLAQVAESIKDMVASNRPKADWTDEELLKVYDQDATEVAEILRKRTHGRPCIVFDADGSVNIEASLKLIRTAKRQPTGNTFSWKGKPVRVYRAGEFLAEFLEESPFCPGIALVDGYCPESATTWTGVDHKTRVMVRIYVREIETAALSKMQMKDICTDAHKLTETEFEDKYSEAQLRYQELERQDKLPKLCITPTDIRPHPYRGKVDDGFGG
ncbi:MAG: hypothetical protein ACXAC5_11745 [Promethearchaeota archaeon]|jgi:hypothetical protein